VSGPRGRRRAVGSPRQELAEATEVGGLYLRRLVRAQLGLSLSALVAFGGLFGALPLALFTVPGIQGVDVLGVPLALLLVVPTPFPFFLAIGWLYQRRADALDAAFRELADPP
jgi:hypothetical protein